jgi:8-oxo-dGTP pyrophosphatase MutT (NUDIX family)
MSDGVEARPAASLIVVRRGGAGPEVLMARRSDRHRFMPGVLVFPGGAVDPADYDAESATALTVAVRQRLQRSATPALAQALAAAAARELEEEVGLSLGRPPALDGLSYLCRAITPAGHPVRFDARFFVVDAARVSGTPAGSAELEEPGWYGLTAAGACRIAGATRAVLAQLARFLADPAPEPGAVPVLRERVWQEE